MGRLLSGALICMLVGPAALWGDTFADSRDGGTYRSVRIGGHVWMAENLAYLPKVSPPSTGSKADPHYYVYGYSGTNVSAAKETIYYAKYGVLYNWAAAQNACPSGWHLPSDEEWEQVAELISKEKGGYSKGDHFWTNVGGHLKAKSGWNSDGNGTDDYGFSGLPGGVRNAQGSFWGVGAAGVFWSSTERDSSSALDRSLAYYDSKSGFGPYGKEGGLSVRCVAD